MSLKAATFEEHCLERIRRKAPGTFRHIPVLQRLANRRGLQDAQIGASRVGLDIEYFEVVFCSAFSLGGLMMAEFACDFLGFPRPIFFGVLGSVILFWLVWFGTQIMRGLIRLAPNNLEKLSAIATHYPQLMPAMALRVGKTGVMRTSDLSFFEWAVQELEEALYLDKQLQSLGVHPSPLSKRRLTKWFYQKKKEGKRQAEDQALRVAQSNHPVHLAIRAAQEKSALEKTLPKSTNQTSPSRL